MTLSRLFVGSSAFPKYRCYAQRVKRYMAKYLPIEIDTTRYDANGRERDPSVAIPLQAMQSFRTSIDGRWTG